MSPSGSFSFRRFEPRLCEGTGVVQVDELYNLSGVSRGALIMKSRVVFKFRVGVVHPELLNSVVGDSEAIWLNEWKLIAVEFVRGARPECLLIASHP